MTKVGEHITLDIIGTTKEYDPSIFEKVIHDIAKAAKVTILNISKYKFEPQGFTILALLAESHISFHTFPEKGIISFDFFTCGKVSPSVAIDIIKKEFEHTRIVKKEFYKALGLFKLGNTEAYRVAFNDGTDARFCKEYQIFKNTPDGVFIDKLSGAALFDTKDRFNSGTGWLSFTRPVEGSVYRRADNSYGMRRIEIRSVSSDIHLGHVFPDGPNGLPRYCINATVLEFKTRDEFNLINTKEKV